MPELNKVYGSYKGQGLVLIGIHCDKSIADRDAIAKKNGLTYPICEDKGTLSQAAYKIDGYPTVFLIGRSGKIKKVDPENLGAEVKKALAER